MTTKGIEARRRLEARVARLSTAQLRAIEAELMRQIRTQPDNVRELRIARLYVCGELDRRERRD